MKALVKKNFKNKYTIEAYVGCQQCSTCQWTTCVCGGNQTYAASDYNQKVSMGQSLYNTSYNVIPK